ncbi:unnamed protein product, partial [Ixodes persulcatus]
LRDVVGLGGNGTAEWRRLLVLLADEKGQGEGARRQADVQDPNERANGQATRVLGGNATLVAHGAYLEDDVERLAEKLLLALSVLEGRLVLAAQLRLVVRGELLLLLNPLVRLADVCQVVLAPISLFLHSERRGMARLSQFFLDDSVVSFLLHGCRVGRCLLLLNGFLLKVTQRHEQSSIYGVHPSHKPSATRRLAHRCNEIPHRSATECIHWTLRLRRGVPTVPTPRRRQLKPR